MSASIKVQAKLPTTVLKNSHQKSKTVLQYQWRQGSSLASQTSGCVCQYSRAPSLVPIGTTSPVTDVHVSDRHPARMCACLWLQFSGTTATDYNTNQ